MWIKCCSSSFAVGVATAHHMFPFTLSLASHLCVGVWVSLRLGLRYKSRTSPGNLASGFLHVVCACYQVMSCYHVVFNTMCMSRMCTSVCPQYRCKCAGEIPVLFCINEMCKTQFKKSEQTEVSCFPTFSWKTGNVRFTHKGTDEIMSLLIN